MIRNLILAILAIGFMSVSPGLAQVQSQTGTYAGKTFVDLAPGKSVSDGTTTVTNTGSSGKVRVYYTGQKESERGNHQVGNIGKILNRDTSNAAEEFEVDTGGDDTDVENKADDATVTVDGDSANVTNSGDNVTTNIKGNDNTMTAGGEGNTVVFDAGSTGNTGNGEDNNSSGDVDLNGSSTVWGGTGTFTVHN